VPATEEDGGTPARTIVLQQEMSISGRVVWEDGSPAAGRDVEVQGASQTKTDADGRFSLPGLRPGEHEVRAGRDRGWRWGGVEGVQSLVRAGTVDLLLALPDSPPARLVPRAKPAEDDSAFSRFAAGTIEPDVAVVGPTAVTEAVVTVVDDAGSPVVGAFVRFWPSASGPIAGETDTSGRFRVRGWRSGSIGELTVDPPASESHQTLMARHIDPWAPRDEVVPLERGAVTTGFVRDVAHRPIDAVVVEVRLEDGTWESAVGSTRGGAFELPARSPGTLTLRARSIGRPRTILGKDRTPRVSDHVGPSREVVVGATDVVLYVDLGPPLRIRFEGWPVVSPTIDAAIVSEADLPTLFPVEAPVSADGTVEFVQLDPDASYALWVGPLFDGRFALARGLRGAQGVQSIRLESGLRSTVRLSGPETSEPAEVTAHVADFTARAARRADGSFVFWGLPVGTWPVRAMTSDGTLEGEATCTAGAEAEIRLVASEWGEIDNTVELTTK
jgi:hypothetical protein